MAAVYAANGQTGMVYTSSEGLDEMAPTGPVSVWEFKDGEVTETEFDPTVELGLAKVTVEDLKGGEPALNAQLACDFFAGKDVPFRTTALLNAASAIVADGHLVPADANLTERFKVAYAIAEETVDSGNATALLDKWITAAQAMKAEPASTPGMLAIKSLKIASLRSLVASSSLLFAVGSLKMAG